MLVDSDLELYQFRNNLPSHVKAVKQQYPTYWDKMRLLEEHVVLRDRRHMFRVFPQCFVASEAVDVLLQLQLVKSRGEGVHLMRKLNQKVFCCQHVCFEHAFSDDYLFFEFVPPQERMPEPKTTVADIPKKKDRTFARNLKATKSVHRGGDASLSSRTRSSSSPRTVVSTWSVDPKVRAKEVRRRLEAFRQAQVTSLSSTGVVTNTTTFQATEI